MGVRSSAGGLRRRVLLAGQLRCAELQGDLSANEENRVPRWLAPRAVPLIWKGMW